MYTAPSKKESMVREAHKTHFSFINLFMKLVMQLPSSRAAIVQLPAGLYEDV